MLLNRSQSALSNKPDSVRCLCTIFCRFCYWDCMQDDIVRPPQLTRRPTIVRHLVKHLQRIILLIRLKVLMTPQRLRFRFVTKFTQQQQQCPIEWHFIQDNLGYRHRVIYSTRVNTPIRTAENFEAVEWATGFSIKNGCIEACFSSPTRT